MSSKLLVYFAAFEKFDHNLLQTKYEIKVLFYILIGPKYQFRNMWCYIFHSNWVLFVFRGLSSQKMSSELFLHIYPIKNIIYKFLQLNSEIFYCFWFWIANIFYESKKVSDNIKFESFFYQIKTTNSIILILYIFVHCCDHLFFII